MGERLIRENSFTVTGINVGRGGGMMNGLMKGGQKEDKSCEGKKNITKPTQGKLVSKSQRASPSSLRSYSFFIHLQLSAGAPADKQLQLYCQRLMPLPEHHLMIIKCMIN